MNRFILTCCLILIIDHLRAQTIFNFNGTIYEHRSHLEGTTYNFKSNYRFESNSGTFDCCGLISKGYYFQSGDTLLLFHEPYFQTNEIGSIRVFGKVEGCQTNNNSDSIRNKIIVSDIQDGSPVLSIIDLDQWGDQEKSNWFKGDSLVFFDRNNRSLVNIRSFGYSNLVYSLDTVQDCDIIEAKVDAPKFGIHTSANDSYYTVKFLIKVKNDTTYLKSIYSDFVLKPLNR